MFSALLALALHAQIAVTTDQGEGIFPLSTAGGKATIVCDDNDAEVVMTAAQCLSADVEAVTGRSLNVDNSVATGFGRKDRCQCH